jgi:hypothetical protein
MVFVTVSTKVVDCSVGTSSAANFLQSKTLVESLKLYYKMNFQFSHALCPSEYETADIYQGITVRRHKTWTNEDVESLRAQDAWKLLVGSTKKFYGNLASLYSFMQLTVPECLPERLEIISYINEFAFLHDGT